MSASEVTTRSMAKKRRIEALMPSKEELLAACAGVEDMLAYARSVENDTSQDWHWGFGAPINYFSAINYLSSNEMFIARNVAEHATPVLESGLSRGIRNPDPRTSAYLNSVKGALQMLNALAALKRGAPEWLRDPLYGGEFASW
tara:strand:+ start:5054 stop:5485 length:432 start_codon:yes stop_codon:yes gene_type:complete